jgi:hypothetical protein
LQAVNPVLVWDGAEFTADIGLEAFAAIVRES